MADIKISDLLPASTPLDGTETLPIVQAGNTVKASTQDIASLYSLGYTAEDVANKSTDSSFAGATDLRYPSQLAVKTYVDNTLGNAGWGLNGNSGTTSANFIGTTDANDFVLKTNNVERMRVYGSQPYMFFNGGIYANNSTNITEIVAFSNVSGNYSGAKLLNIPGSSGALMIYKGVSTTNAQLQASNISANRTLQLPDTNGTLVATVNGVAPDSAGNVSVSSGWSLTGNSGTTAGTNFIGTTDSQDLVFKTNNSEVFRATLAGGITSLGSIGVTVSTGGSRRLRVFNPSNSTKIAEIAVISDIGSLKLGNGISTSTLQSTNITASRILELPDKSGTLATEDYLVYTALIDANSGSPIATVLKNTLGVTINWTNPFNGQILGTASSGNPFTIDKTWISNGSYDNGGQPYFVTSSRQSGTQVRFKFFLYDGTITSTPNFDKYSIEIRVYP